MLRAQARLIQPRKLLCRDLDSRHLSMLAYPILRSPSAGELLLPLPRDVRLFDRDRDAARNSGREAGRSRLIPIRESQVSERVRAYQISRVRLRPAGFELPTRVRP